MAVQLSGLVVPLMLAVTAAVVLLLDAFLPDRAKFLVLWLGIIMLGVAFVITVPQLWSGAQAFCRQGADIVCAYDLARYGVVLHLAILVGAVAVLLLSVQTVVEESIPPGEYVFLLLCSVTGALVLTAAGDFATLVVGLETLSLPVFGMVALRGRVGRVAGGEAALKLFLVSVASTALLLFGVSWIYAARGSLWLTDLTGDPSVDDRLQPVLAVGIAFAVLGFGFKVAAVPFHAWAPDTYEGAPLPVAAYLAVVSKVAGFAGLVVLLGRGLEPYAVNWAPVLAIVAALTMTVGNLVALRQRSAIRLLAWSSIGQAGYALAPFAGGGNPVAGVDPLAAPVSYIVAYAAMTMTAFAVVVAVTRDHPDGQLESYRGLLWRRPIAGIALAFALVALAGVPPGLVGLFAKVAVFRAVLLGGAGWLAMVMAVNVVIALYYYVSWTVLVVQRPTAEQRKQLPKVPTAVPAPIGAAVAVSVTATVILSVLPQLVFAARDLFPVASP
ncbi:MAG: NADH-quinone oxidoreductase subunit N [Streptosporangiales bacterium]|nr:NADH-quinone oxidoreductase subunit N [Streptosporangiales bacterium]